jgi:hypothetical protein
MNRTILGGMALTSLLLAGRISEARSDEPGPSSAPTVVSASDDVSKSDAGGETWRFRRHRGQWWYWLPSEKWVVWNGERWVDHVPQATTRSSGGGGRYAYPPQQGNWGPVHYDRWGNRQYPYSRRKSGLQQLGPVPAMGGVRSLPGWGGER